MSQKDQETLLMFGKQVKQLRHPYTQEEIAERSGFSIHFIQDIEIGKSNPSYLDVIKLADAIGAFPHDFFDLEFVRMN